MTESKEDYSWLWRSLNIATPYTFGRFVQLSEVNPNEDEIEESYSIPALTLYRSLNGHVWGHDDNLKRINSFSVETLVSIVMSKSEADTIEGAIAQWTNKATQSQKRKVKLFEVRKTYLLM